jgi:hypothetical protein
MNPSFVCSGTSMDLGNDWYLKFLERSASILFVSRMEKASLHFLMAFSCGVLASKFAI